MDLLSTEELDFVKKLKYYGLSANEITKITGLSIYWQNKIFLDKKNDEISLLPKLVLEINDFKGARKTERRLRCPVNRWENFCVDSDKNRILMDIYLQDCENEIIRIEIKYGLDFQFLLSKNNKGYRGTVNLNDWPYLRPLFQEFKNREFIFNPECYKDETSNSSLFLTPLSLFYESMIKRWQDLGHA